MSQEYEKRVVTLFEKLKKIDKVIIKEISTDFEAIPEEKNEVALAS